jgi:hypothetical protein
VKGVHSLPLLSPFRSVRSVTIRGQFVDARATSNQQLATSN